ncbi:Uma2 family endonuclease [Aggregatilinea lenta]|uniref:Uma2 family endonuclease n=1 Tax=Aggregatilinea lenta TaxID=913108 RepID=UPI000E5B015C|nr:Uma2 family endonuclease [Aggregatilinea lenta]
MVQTHNTTLEEYLRFIALPENDGRRFEYVEGEITEVVSNNYCSLIAARILGRVIAYVEDRDLGYIMGADGGFQVGEDRYIPDVSFISKKRQLTPPHDTFNPNPPDLAVEVLSPTDRPRIVRTKIHNYTAAGTVVWVVDPEAKMVEVYTSGQPAKTLHLNDTLDGGAVLPGFTLAMRDIFAE